LCSQFPGVYRDVGPGDVYIDLNLVPELVEVKRTEGLTIGAGITLSRAIEILERAGNSQPGYKYAALIAKHFRRVANVPVRNVSSITLMKPA
jgi:xanthine dehydrogenase/oxidase